jgi:hypothetical protein
VDGQRVILRPADRALPCRLKLPPETVRRRHVRCTGQKTVLSISCHAR